METGPVTMPAKKAIKILKRVVAPKVSLTPPTTSKRSKSRSPLLMSSSQLLLTHRLLLFKSKVQKAGILRGLVDPKMLLCDLGNICNSQRYGLSGIRKAM